MSFVFLPAPPQERHGSICVWHRKGRFGRHRRPADAGRPDPVGQRWGRQVGHSGGHGRSAEGTLAPSGVSTVCLDPWWMTALNIMCLVLQCCVGPIKMEVGRFKAGPFHSERRLSQSSQVIYWNSECWIEKRSHLLFESKTTKEHWVSLFQMSETGSSKAASQSCLDSGNLPDDPDKLSKTPDC